MIHLSIIVDIFNFPRTPESSGPFKYLAIFLTDNVHISQVARFDPYDRIQEYGFLSRHRTLISVLTTNIKRSTVYTTPDNSTEERFQHR